MKKCLLATISSVLLTVFSAACTGSESPTTDLPITPVMPETNFFLTVTQPTNESITDAGKVQVIGITVPGAVVSVNGDVAEVDKEGNFTMTVFLEEGPNLIEVVASDLDGHQKNYSSTIIFVPSDVPETGFFLTVTQPAENSSTNNDEVEVKGQTTSGAVVTVNGELAEVDSEGNFIKVIFIEEGPNLIEVVASDIEGNQESCTLVVICEP